MSLKIVTLFNAVFTENFKKRGILKNVANILSTDSRQSASPQRAKKEIIIGLSKIKTEPIN